MPIYFSVSFDNVNMRCHGGEPQSRFTDLSTNEAADLPQFRVERPGCVKRSCRVKKKGLMSVIISVRRQIWLFFEGERLGLNITSTYMIFY